jgi:hypothetical protein
LEITQIYNQDFDLHMFQPGSNPKIGSYNASAGKIYNTAST